MNSLSCGGPKQYSISMFARLARVVRKSSALILLSGLVLSSCQTLTEADLSRSQNAIAGKSQVWKVGAQEVHAGLYSGYIYLNGSKRSLPFEANVLPQRLSDGVLKTKMIMTVLQGSYTSHEYSSIYLPFVDITPSKGHVHVKGKQPVGFEKVSLDGKVLTGVITEDGKKHEFLVVWNESQSHMLTKASGSVQNTVSGQYRGQCLGKKMLMDVSVKKISGLASNVRFLELPVDVGVYGVGRESCDGKRGYCRKFDYKGTLNQASQQLDLANKFQKKTCSLKGRNGAVDCGGCLFVRDKSYQVVHEVEGLKYSFDVNKIKSLVSKDDLLVNPEVEDIEGNYKGFVFDEKIGISQPVYLGVKGKRKGGKSYLSGFAKHYWQNKINKNYTAYSFYDRRFVSERPVFVFDGNTDGVLYVTGFYADAIVGQWYSKSSGRIGQVVLKKNTHWSALPLKETQSLVRSAYYNGDNIVKLKMKPATSKGFYDFFPNKLFGISFKKGDKKPRETFVAGVVDRRSGYVGLLRRDRNVLVGSISPEEVRLKKRFKGKHHKESISKHVAYSTGKKTGKKIIKKNIEINEKDLKQAKKFERLLRDVDNNALKHDQKAIF